MVYSGIPGSRLLLASALNRIDRCSLYSCKPGTLGDRSCCLRFHETHHLPWAARLVRAHLTICVDSPTGPSDLLQTKGPSSQREPLVLPPLELRLKNG